LPPLSKRKQACALQNQLAADREAGASELALVESLLRQLPEGFGDAGEQSLGCGFLCGGTPLVVLEVAQGAWAVAIARVMR
jgi:hypothetical protein